VASIWQQRRKTRTNSAKTKATPTGFEGDADAEPEDAEIARESGESSNVIGIVRRRR
jgi:hypothetical protein